MLVNPQTHKKEDILDKLFLLREIFITNATKTQSLHVFLTTTACIVWLYFVLFFLAGFHSYHLAISSDIIKNCTIY